MATSLPPNLVISESGIDPVSLSVFALHTPRSCILLQLKRRVHLHGDNLLSHAGVTATMTMPGLCGRRILWTAPMRRL